MSSSEIAQTRHAVATAALPRLFRRLPAQLDLRDEVQLESLLSTADALLGRVTTLDQLEDLEWTLTADPEAWPQAAQLAVKLARSKGALLSRRSPLHLSVVLPVYAEHQRIRRPHEHPLGEGFLDRKLRQLSWLVGSDSRRSYELLVVDDGCPHGSGEVAKEVLRRRHPHAPVRVSFIADAIQAKLPIVAPMRSADESRKGGAVYYGLWQVTRQRRRGHVVIYTDADLSTHLGQSGLLVSALDRPGTLVAAGSRRDRRSVVVKGHSRSARGRLFIYLWKQLLPELSYLDDTQCGFKAFSAQVASRLAEAPHERGFAFDIELLLRCELLSHHSISSVPVAWIDSEAASTTVDLDPYLSMLRSVVELGRHHRGRSRSAEPFARAIEALDEPGWNRLVERIGSRLETVDPVLDATTPHVPASELANVMGQAA